MAIQFLPVLKSLPAIVGVLREVTSSLDARRATGAVVKVEERTKKLEEDLLKTGRAVTELAKQVETLAVELRAHAETLAARERRAARLQWIAVGALIAAVVALAVSFAR